MYSRDFTERVIVTDVLNYKHLGRGCRIHSTAIIEDGAKIGDNAVIGAYSFIGKNVTIGDNCELKSHVVVEGQTKIGNRNQIYSFAVVGQNPQDLKYAGEKSEVIIGDGNRIREHVTIHPGTKGGGMVTIIGNNNLLMVGTHVAHDCIIGNNCVLANNTTLGGHVQIGDFAIIGGLSGIHQFVRIGAHAMVGGMSGVTSDVIPFGTVKGNRSTLEGLNIVGMKRRDFSRDDIHGVRHLFKDVFMNKRGTLESRIKAAEKKYKGSGAVKKVIDFLKNCSKKSVCVPEGS